MIFKCYFRHPEDERQKKLLGKGEFHDRESLGAWSSNQFTSKKLHCPPGWVPMIEITDPSTGEVGCVSAFPKGS